MGSGDKREVAGPMGEPQGVTLSPRERRRKARECPGSGSRFPSGSAKAEPSDSMWLPVPR